MPSLRFWRRKRPVALDELGGTVDGALVIVDEDGSHLHVTPPRIASSLRFLLNRLHLPGSDGLPARVAVTSALRGEGVSYMTRSLGAVIAYDLEQTVALVDLNWRDPPTDPKSEPDSRPTLATAVEEGLDVTEIIRPTTNPRLSLVAPGVVARARRPAMAASRALEDVIDKLAQQFDHLLFDLPPVLAHSDTITLARLADGVVLVVQHGITSGTQVESALGELAGREVLGVVLNRADSSIPPRLRKMVGG
jgi:Mrp family chromosome partitioning ATPase